MWHAAAPVSKIETVTVAVSSQVSYRSSDIRAYMSNIAKGFQAIRVNQGTEIVEHQSAGCLKDIEGYRHGPCRIVERREKSDTVVPW